MLLYMSVLIPTVFSVGHVTLKNQVTLGLEDRFLSSKLSVICFSDGFVVSVSMLLL